MALTDTCAAGTVKGPRWARAQRAPASDRSLMRIDHSERAVARQPSTPAPAAKPAAPELVMLGDLTPSQTAQKLIEWCAAKSILATDRLIVLGLLAGVFIAVGGAFFTAVMAELPLSHGPSRLLGGLAFSTGLLLVCISGAELSTGNCMMFAACATRRITFGDLRRNLLISYAANGAGALALVLLIAGSGLLQTGHGHVAAAIAEAKMNLSFEQAFFRGILCNALVCLAVWMILAGRTIPSKLAGLIFPISAFIALGFEHSIANLYLLPAGLLAGAAGSLAAASANLLAVTLGNLVGGAVIALVFWMAYLRGEDREPRAPKLLAGSR